MKTFRNILLTALLVGTLDLTAAIIQFKLTGGDNPLQILRFIASGVFGSAAFGGGLSMVVWGLLLHYFIATGWTAAYFVIYPLLSRSSYPLLPGMVYGVVIWLCMNLVVVPLSHTPPLPPDLLQNVTGILILILFVGLPISIIFHRSRVG